MSRAYEINFDGIVGPTHNYAGLSFGNVASQKHGLSISRPREAALQGLAKMKFLHDLGVKQAVLPPHPRPDLPALRRIGFDGSDAEVLAKAFKQEPRLLAAVYSASAMWAANAATVSPSVDASDGRVHFTPANLITQFHRSIEAATTAKYLRAIFPVEDLFAHHDSLAAADAFADEGAANHVRLSAAHGKAGLEIFVYGRSTTPGSEVPRRPGFGAPRDPGLRSTSEPGVIGGLPSRFPSRQTLEACRAIARLHRLKDEQIVFAKQNPSAIDAGAFHNDVVVVGNENVLLMHAAAFENVPAVLDEIRRKFAAVCGGELFIITATEDELSLADAVESYIFNSQLITLPNGTMSLIAPIECRDHARVQAFVQRVLSSGNPIKSVHYLDVRQSMKNGGGPACLRLRVVLMEEQMRAVRPGVMFNNALHEKLVTWVQRNYRESIQMEDLADPALMRESREALEQLGGILGLDISGDGGAG